MFKELLVAAVQDKPIVVSGSVGVFSTISSFFLSVLPILQVLAVLLAISASVYAIRLTRLRIKQLKEN